MANAQHDPVSAQLERHKFTLIASLSSVAEQMRHCANVADQFAQMLTQASFNGNLSLPGAVYAGSKRHGMEEEDVEGAVKRRRTANKKAKDPDAPKRAASSYIFFQNDLRQELRKQHPDISPSEIMSRVSKQWAEMTPDQKAPYERLQAEAKQKWEAEKRAYDERRGIVAPTKRTSRTTAAATVEEPVQPATVGLPVSAGASIVPKQFQGAISERKIPESSGSSTDHSLSDKSSGEEDGTGGNSGGEDDEEIEVELAAPSPPPTKSKAKRKADVAAPTSTSAKPKGKVVGASAGPTPTPARLEKKKRSKV